MQHTGSTTRSGLFPFGPLPFAALNTISLAWLRFAESWGLRIREVSEEVSQTMFIRTDLTELHKGEGKGFEFWGRC